MIAYTTIILLILILAKPIACIIALIVNLFRIPKMTEEMLEKAYHRSVK